MTHPNEPYRVKRVFRDNEPDVFGLFYGKSWGKPAIALVTNEDDALAIAKALKALAFARDNMAELAIPHAEALGRVTSLPHALDMACDALAAVNGETKEL